ncbi:MAG: FliM/FliN family flagellar motor switch protein [Candidatus Saganbacteria bacterium]|nr:FliM/FliN family flagellar motor switch protein [Candidatus Saganbacteria bacterium]
MEKAAEKKEGTATSGRKLIKLTPAIGDWTTLKPSRVPEKRIKMGLYGFDRIGEGALSEAHLIHYNFANSFIRAIKLFLGIGGELYTVSAEQSSYSDFVKKLFRPMVHGNIEIQDLPGSIHFCMELTIANTLINHGLGSRDLTSLNRKLTEIEEQTLTILISEHLNTYAEVFSGAVSNPKFGVRSSPEFSVDPTISPTTTFSSFTIEIAIGDNPPAKLLIAYQSKTLKVLLEKKASMVPLRPLDLTKLPESVYDKILVGAVANLGESLIATDDLKKLEIGDIVSLDVRLGSALLLTLGEKAKLLVGPGIHNSKKSLRIIGSAEGRAPKFLEEESVLLAEEKISAPKEKELLEKKEEERYPIEEELEKEEEEFPEEEEEALLEEELPEEEEEKGL